MSRARQKAVTVRFSDEEWVELENLCELHGLNKNAVVRAGVHALRGYGPPQRVRVDDGFVAAVSAINAVGVNLNQVARHVNGVTMHGEKINARAVNAAVEAVANASAELAAMVRDAVVL